MLCGRQITNQIFQYITTASVFYRLLFQLEKLQLQPALSESKKVIGTENVIIHF